MKKIVIQYVSSEESVSLRDLIVKNELNEV
jgi:hypothetical protein